MNRESQNQNQQNRAAASDPVEEQVSVKGLTPPAISFGSDSPPADNGVDPSSWNIIQPSLQVGGADDIFEREANTVAAQVVGGGSSLPQINRIPAGFSSPAQRKTQQHAPDTMTSQLSASRSGGQNLDHGVRQEMESSFGYDFSQVRVHTGTQAAQMSSAIGAHAFTQGNHIYFNQNNYQTENSAGKQLLAHELTHVVQQGAAQRKSAKSQNKNAVLGQRKPVNVNQRDNSNSLRRCAQEPSFEPEIGKKTTTLENNFGNFKATHGLVRRPGQDGHVYGTYHFELEMEAKETTGDSKIGFVQTVRRGSAPGNWSKEQGDPGLSSEERANRTDDEGWRVDRSSTSGTPFYGARKDGENLKRASFNMSNVGMGASTKIIKFGKHGGTNAYLIDIPSVVDPSVLEFATTPMDVETGTQFGIISWGYHYDSSSHTWTEETPQIIDGNSDRAKGRDGAMEHWNENVATEGSGIDKVPGI